MLCLYSQVFNGAAYCRKCQTATASPAEPGDLPINVRLCALAFLDGRLHATPAYPLATDYPAYKPIQPLPACRASLPYERLDTARLVVARAIHLGRHRHKLHSRLARNRLPAAQPPANPARIQHDRHAVVQLADGSACFCGQTCSSASPPAPSAPISPQRLAAGRPSGRCRTAAWRAPCSTLAA